MKKLLVLMLVLGLATMANAVTVSISGLSTIGVGATQSYTVSYSGTPALGSIDVDAVADLAAKGTLSNAVIVATGRDPVSDWIGPPAGANSNGYEISMANATINVPLGTTLFTFDLTATGSLGQVIALSISENSFFDAAFNQLDPGSVGLSGLDVTIVPEPITMVLLGLGGLFLRRRK